MGLSRLPSLVNRVVEIDRLPVHYARAGSGAPVVLLHGWGAEIASFGLIPSILAERFDVIALDLPGFGQTPLPSRPWTTDDYAELVRRCLERLDVEHVTLVGHSFGGKTSLTIAARHPELVRKLILVDSAGIRPSRGPGYYGRVYAVKGARRILGLPVLRSLREPALRRLYSAVGSGDFNAATDPILRATLVKVVNEDRRHLLPSIKAPTLLVWGSEDRDTPLSDGQTMERLIPDAGLVVIKGAGHFSYLFDVDYFCRVVTHFVEN
jgi:pimeloyl-ACP methyl ester carboxylesterase